MVLMNPLNKFTTSVLAIILLSGLLAVSACNGVSAQSLDVGDPAPDFKLNDLNGNTVSLSSLKGKAVFINFWTTRCPPCIAEMPYFQEIFDDWETRDDIVMLLINMGESTATVKNFVQSNNYTFPVLLDSQHEVARKYSIRYTPTTFFISQEGVIQLNIAGAYKDKVSVDKQLAGFVP